MNAPIPSWYRLPTILAFFFSLSAATSLPAFAAQPVNGQSSTTVKFGDLNLNRDADSRELFDRLSRAADRVCSKSLRVTSPLDAFGYRRAYLSCYRDTLSAAVQRIHHEQVSALLAATSHQNTR
jgi:UrcA family protein